MTERRSPFYNNIVRHGATIGRVGGDFISARYYTDPKDEHINTRANVGMQDLSTMGKLDIKGPGAEALVNYVLVNDIAAMRPGQVRYSTVCREDGGIMDDLTVFRLADEHFMVVTGSVNRWKMLPWMTHHAQGRNAYVTDITPAIAFPTIQGPRSRDFLKSVMQDADLDGLKRWSFTRGRIGDTKIMVSRTGVTGELGFELFVPADEAAVLWDTLIAAGRDFGFQPYGVIAMFTLGLEKGYPAHGIDMDERRSPFHVGLDRWVKFEKGDFIGREALLKIRDEGVTERWAGLVVEGDTPAADNAPVYAGAETVGHVTYSAMGHSVGLMLATAHLKYPYWTVGTELTIEIDGARVGAKVSKLPFFDPEGARLRA